MAYTSQTRIQARLNGQDLTPFLDDDRDGSADTGLLDQIIANVQDDIDGMLSSIYSVPFAAPPPIVKTAADIFVCFELYRRRLVPDEKNPFFNDRNRWLDKLRRIGEGEIGLDATITRAFTPGALVGRTTAIGNDTTM